MKIALYEPDIPQNVGSFIRLCACLDVPLHLIEPCGFVWDERKVRAAALDYLPLTRMTRHVSFARFEEWRAREGGRLVLLTTRSPLPYTGFAFRPDDILLLGRESSGVPEAVHEKAEAALTIPLSPSCRSLNVALAAAMALGEALRQTAGFPQGE